MVGNIGSKKYSGLAITSFYLGLLSAGPFLLNFLFLNKLMLLLHNNFSPIVFGIYHLIFNPNLISAFFGLIAIILGIIALIKIKGGSLKGKAFAVFGILLGILGIIFLFLEIVFLAIMWSS